MKKIVLLCLLVCVCIGADSDCNGIEDPKPATIDTPSVETESRAMIEVVKIDDCEYLIVTTRSGDSVAVCHKSNCKNELCPKK